MIESNKLADLFKDNPRRGQEILPELIKKLIIASANTKLSSLRFPSGDSIWTPGFDGYVTDITIEDKYLPLGNSVWECGTSRDYKTKINDDYKKRTEEVTHFDKSEYTFILCTPFVYDASFTNLENDMQNQKIWKNVKIFDATIITDWLNEHIEVIIWLLRKFNSSNTDLRISTAEITLDTFLNLTKPQISLDFIMCSQNNNDGNQIEIFQDNLKSQAVGTLILFSPVSVEHGVLFSLAVISTDTAIFEKTIVVENIESLIFVEKNYSKKIVIINFCWNGLGQRLNNNRYVYVVNDEGKYPQQKLNNIRFDDYKINIEKMGFDSGTAHNITKRTNRNISCFKRMYAVDRLLKIPFWAQEMQRDVIIPLALVSEVDKRFEGDIKILDQLYGNQEYIKILESQINKYESPVFHLDNLYRINYKEEVLFTLNIDCQDSYVKKLEGIFQSIMSTADPLYLQDVTKWDYRRENSIYSNSLIEGIIETFIILVIKNSSSQLYYDNFVKKIINNALCDFALLNSVIVYLPLLAELSPKAVINFINDAIEENNDIFRKSFETEYGVSFIQDKSKFYDYKFAIDKCLYNEETAIDSLRLIFKLYNSDYKFPKGFRISSFVNESFCPFTSFIIPVKPSDKFKLLKSLINDDNRDKSLSIMEAFINGKVTNFMYGTPIYRYRENPEKNDININELLSVSLDAILFLLDNTCDRLPLYNDLFKQLSFLDKKTVDAILAKIENDIENGDDEFKSHINYILLDKIYDIRRFVEKSSNDSWKYVSVYLDQLIMLYESSIPTTPYLKYRYIIINPSYDIPYLNPTSWSSTDKMPNYYEEENEKRAAIYKKAFDELFASNIEDLSTRIIKDMKDEGLIGNYLSQKSSDKLNDIKKIIEMNKLNALTGYINFMSANELKIIFEGLDEEEKKTLINCLGQNENAFLVIKGTQYEELYWKKFNHLYTQKSKDFEEFAIFNLLRHNPLALASHYAYSGENISYDEKILLLESLAVNIKDIMDSKDTHNINSISTLVSKLDDEYYDERLISCELALLPILFSSTDNYTKGIKKFFLENPLSLYQFLSACSKSNLGDNTVASKVVSDCTISIQRNTIVSIELIRDNLKEITEYNNKINNKVKKESLLETWFNVIMNELETEQDKRVIYMVRSFLVLVLSLSFSYNINNEQDLIVAKLVENLGIGKSFEDRKQISVKFYTSKFNSFGVRNVGDGSSESIIASNYLELSEMYKIEYPIVSEALKMLSYEFNSISNQDRQRKILGEF